MKDVNAGLLSSLERAKTASDAKCSEMAVLNSRVMSEVSQLHAAMASKEEQIAKLKVRLPLNPPLLSLQACFLTWR